MDFPTIVYTLQIITITGCIFIGGLSSTLSLWIVPLSLRLPPRLLARQFTQTFTWGWQYIHPSSRVLAFILLSTTILTSQLPSSLEAQKWRMWATAVCVLIGIAPYETYLIFPINDRVAEIAKELEKDGDREELYKKELTELLRKWQARNSWRVIAPVMAGVVGMMNLSQKC